MRSVKEWIGKTDDAKIPPRVRDRIFERDNHICHWCKIAIKVPMESWQADHVKALVNGGEHREGNLAPIHSHCHLEKTGIDVAAKSKAAKLRKAHHRIVPDRPKMQGAGFPKTPSQLAKQARASTKLPPPGRVNIFTKEVIQ